MSVPTPMDTFKCESCNGSGGYPHPDYPCGPCKGIGVVFKERPRKRAMVYAIGPGVELGRQLLPLTCPSDDCSSNELYVNADGDSECDACGSVRRGAGR